MKITFHSKTMFRGREKVMVTVEDVYRCGHIHRAIVNEKTAKKPTYETAHKVISLTMDCPDCFQNQPEAL